MNSVNKFILRQLALVWIVFFLTACDSSSNMSRSFEAEATFDPANGLMPTTNDLLFSGSMDGTLNIPNPTDNPIISQINALDGFSNLNPVLADFATPIDASSLKVGETVRVFNITNGADDFDELDETEIVAMVPPDQPKTLAIVPLVPFDPKTRYAVVLTSGIKNTSGVASSASLSYLATKGSTPLEGNFAPLEPIRVINNGVESLVSALASPSISTYDIVLSWTFQTQSISDVLDTLTANAVAGDISISSISQTTKDINPLLQGKADIYIGKLTVPYYLEVPSTASPLAALTGSWKGIGGSDLTKFNPTPVKNADLTIPVLMTVPNGNTSPLISKPTNGWPITIFQHGITRSRTDLLPVADALAQAGFASIAIDLPLHGQAKTLDDGMLNTLHAGNNPLFSDDIEPTFDLDLANNSTSAPGPDGLIDSSGTHFINLSSLLTSRDNTRQGVSNLITLRRSLDNIDSNSVDIDTSRVGLIAYSLGGLVGTTYLGVETMVTPSSLVTTGGSITDILKTSGEYAPRILAGLGAAGIESDAAVAQYFGASQQIVDSADPINFATKAAARHPIHLVKVLNDKLVPNATTERLAGTMAAIGVSTTNSTIAAGNPGIVRFSKGDHGSFLSPAAGLDVTLEIQNQVVNFLASNGTEILITDGNVIEATP